MINRQIILYCVSAFAGFLLLLAALYLSIGLVGVGHNAFVMPQKAIFAPGNLYALAWPILLPMSCCKTRWLKLLVRYIVLIQLIVASFYFVKENGIEQTVGQMSYGSSVASAVLLLIVIYFTITATLLIASFIPVAKPPK